MKLFSNRLSGGQTLSLAIALMLVVTAAKAATVTITGTMPTQNTDNSTIPATGSGSLSNVRLEYGTCNGTAFGTKVGEVSRAPTAPGAAFSYTLNLDPGTSCVRALVSNTYGKESD